MAILIRLIVVVALITGLFVFVHFAEARELSKREVYAVYCGIDKYSVTHDMKKLSRREIWSLCTGGDKVDAPGCLRKQHSTKKKNTHHEEVTHIERVQLLPGRLNRNLENE